MARCRPVLWRAMRGSREARRSSGRYANRALSATLIGVREAVTPIPEDRSMPSAILTAQPSLGRATNSSKRVGDAPDRVDADAAPMLPASPTGDGSSSPPGIATEKPSLDTSDSLAGLMRMNAAQNSWARSPLKFFDNAQVKDAQTAAYGCIGLVAILRADSTGAGLADDADVPYEPFSPRLREQLFSALAVLSDFTFGCLDRVREGFEFPPTETTAEPNRHG